MTEEHEQHLDLLVRNTSYLMKKKYRKGQEEHGGALWNMTPLELAENIIEEAIDQLVYGLTLKMQLEEEIAFDEEQQHGDFGEAGR